MGRVLRRATVLGTLPFVALTALRAARRARSRRAGAALWAEATAAAATQRPPAGT